MKTITVCGSCKFKKEITESAEKLALKGYCVLTPIELTKTGENAYTEAELSLLGEMHKEKIRLSDGIFVVNVGGYIGESTKSEIEYAKHLKKEITYYTEQV